MCRVEERIYVSADGRRSKFEDAYPCDKARGGKLCSKVKKRTSEYYPKQAPLSRDDTPSPINPPTPTGAGTYLVQQRRPSGSSSRPSTRDGHKTVAPAEIHISFGSRKNKDKKYPLLSVSSKTQKRSSLGASPIGPNDLAIDSPGSDASNTIRTGFPEAPLPPPAGFGRSDGYIATPTIPHGYHHRHTSSASSSQTPSLYITSDPDRDYESPASHRTARYPPTIVHNPNTVIAPAPSSPSRGQSAQTSRSYRTSIISPQHYAEDAHTPDGLYPLDYADFADRSASSHASSGAAEATRKGKDRDNRRRRKEDERLRQEELECEVRAAEEQARADNVKQVRFELGRAESRAKERAENALAEKEKTRAEEREAARWRKQQDMEKQDREQRELEEQLAKERKREKSKPSAKDNTARPTGSRRLSMTQAQLEEQRRLLAAEGLIIENERKAADAREREEQMAAFKQQQETPGYYDPRGGDRSLSGSTLGIARRESISRGNPPALGLSRTGSKRRTSIIQPDPPVQNTQLPPNYSTRPPSARQNNGPPVSFPSSFNKDYRPPSARRPSYSGERPFVVPPRGSSSDLDNPFVPNASVLSPSLVSKDPWDLRNVEAALPNARQARNDRYSTHSRAQQATRAMGQASGYADVFDDESDSQEGFPPSTKSSGKARRNQ
jgi:hypothetical protein